MNRRIGSIAQRSRPPNAPIAGARRTTPAILAGPSRTSARIWDLVALHQRGRKTNDHSGDCPPGANLTVGVRLRTANRSRRGASSSRPSFDGHFVDLDLLLAASVDADSSLSGAGPLFSDREDSRRRPFDPPGVAAASGPAVTNDVESSARAAGTIPGRPIKANTQAKSSSELSTSQKNPMTSRHGEPDQRRDEGPW